MSERYLTILEVSQKQAYIFQSNELKENVSNSEAIAWVMSADYMREKAGENLFCEENNLVYAGGGHTVLAFPAHDDAVRFTKAVTKAVRTEYPGIEVFAVTMKYDGNLPPSENLKELTKALEKKKSERRASFRQGSFGVEETDANTKKPILVTDQANMADKKTMCKIDRELLNEIKMDQASAFRELGGTEGESNFIAIVHIDGNAMGKRVEKIHEEFGGQNKEWDEFRLQLKRFSDSIDGNFKNAYKKMAEHVKANISDGKLGDIEIVKGKFPVRRIITAGDDICFVSEGRIGLECAASFIEKLGEEKNAVDGEGYSACAGVAIVHQKYPFYKAYELAEMLCGNAKKRGASLSCDGTGRDVSVMDWHIEFGEIKDTLDEIRAGYDDADKNRIIARPYIVRADISAKNDGEALCYDMLRDLILRIRDKESGAMGTLKELRNVLKRGKSETEHFMRFHKIDDLVKWDLGNDYKMLFDAIELIDTFIGLK